MHYFKNALLLCALSMFAFASCSGDDDGPAGVGLVGTWKVTTIDYAGTSTTNSGGTTFTSDFTGTGYDMDLTISFEENPNEYTTSGDYSIEVQSTLNGQTFTYNWTNQGFVGAGDWERSGDVITVTTDTGETTTLTVVSETSTELVLAYDEMRTDTQQGVTAVYDVQGTYTFERQ